MTLDRLVNLEQGTTRLDILLPAFGDVTLHYTYRHCYHTIVLDTDGTGIGYFQFSGIAVMRVTPLLEEHVPISYTMVLQDDSAPGLELFPSGCQLPFNMDAICIEPAMRNKWRGFGSYLLWLAEVLLGQEYALRVESGELCDDAWIMIDAIGETYDPIAPVHFYRKNGYTIKFDAVELEPVAIKRIGITRHQPTVISRPDHPPKQSSLPAKPGAASFSDLF